MSWKKGLLFLFLPLSLMTSSCEKDMSRPPMSMNDNGMNNDSTDSSNGNICDDLFESFSQSVQPIFSTSCAKSSCHNSSTAQEGIILESYSQIRGEVENGQVMCAIRHQVGCTNMPYDMQQQIPQEEIQAIQCWIDAGYPS